MMKKLTIFIAFIDLLVASGGAADAEGSAVSTTPDPILSYAEKLSGKDRDRFGKEPQDSLRKESKDLLQSLRSSDGSKTISPEDYRLLKGASARSLAHFAHAAGLAGEGITILVLEDSGSAPHGLVSPDAMSDTAPVSSTWAGGSLSHGRSMEHYVSQIAPRARIIVQHIAKGLSAPRDARIINASFTSDAAETSFSKLFSRLSLGTEPQRLIVSSAGNHQQNLSADPYWGTISRAVLDVSIFAGNLRQDFRTKTSSGMPGDNPKIQNSFIWVMADHMMTATGPSGSSQLSPKSGTSGAAAILSGAAALILGKHPTLTISQLKETILESADRDIIQLFNDGSSGVRMTDDESRGAARSGAGGGAAVASTSTKVYDPAVWGKGVLNIRNAILYADILVEHPDWEPATIRAQMLTTISELENRAATKIQRTFRSRVHKLTSEEIAARPQLYIDTTKAAREFEKSGGEEHVRPSVPDEDDDAFATRMGLSDTKPSGLKRVAPRAASTTASSAAHASGDASSSASAAAAGGGASDTPSASIAIVPADLPAGAPEELRRIRARGSSVGLEFMDLLATSDIKDLLHADVSRRERAWEKYSPWLFVPMNVTLKDRTFYPSRGLTLLELLADSLEYRDSSTEAFQKLLLRAAEDGIARNEHDRDIIIAAWAISGERTYVQDLDSLLGFSRSFDRAIISHLAKTEYGYTLADRIFESELLGIISFLGSDKQDFYAQQLDKIVRALSMLEDGRYDNPRLRRLISFTNRFHAATAYFGKQILDNPAKHDNYPLYNYSTETVNEENMALMSRLLSHFNAR